MCCNLLIDSLTNGDLGSFQILAIMTKTPTSLHMSAFVQFIEFYPYFVLILTFILISPQEHPLGVNSNLT